MNNCNISVVIPTYNRPKQLLVAIEEIFACNPRPDEIIVHIDGSDNVTEAALHQSEFKDIVIIKNPIQVGPGGGRNVAIARAKNTIVASFDDDSYPLDPDYFSRLLQLFEQFPKAAVIGAAIYHIGEEVKPDEQNIRWESAFVGCGCAYRKDIFLQTNGYVELPVAYGMEEVDLALRLHHQGWGILISPWLRVFHDSKLEHHSSPQVTAASIANLALLAYLRYPPSLWWLGIGQCLNRMVWLMRHQRFAGIMDGVFTVPRLIRQHQHHRQVITSQSLLSYLRLRRNVVSIPLSQVSCQ
ncbi:glycosyltransferase [Oculatella sp. LEGE 06141]|uniref:glycosyltransferase family 2 protein n=1 Tax=Oculatella sp. LEGE 06141 TaxID=1828648 RepID=UPI0018809A6D|nr:glycosyltransferase [Oculatella sp. LEGE 06141]MBE9179523.1 glycosyltransferase [Oculatella sp. LEGE 06141]